jgi:hypothetical protein
MLNADKYIDRLRVIVKSNDEMGNKKNYHLPQQRLEFMAYRVKDVIKDYDEDFNKALEYYNELGK